MSSKASQKTISREAELEMHLLSNFSNICIKKCFMPSHNEDDLSKDEKICLGKCIDRGYDYLRMLDRKKF